jgi:hypothetical protein
MENGIEVHTKKTTYMLITPSPEGRAKSYHEDRSFVTQAKYKYLGMTVTSQDLIHEENKGVLNMVSACYYSVHNAALSYADKM